MSDNTQPASSRRALREKRRAEMEAMLASSKAEQEAKKLADVQATEKKDVKPSAGASPADPKTAAPSASKPSVKPEAKTPLAKAPAKPASIKAPVDKSPSGVPETSAAEAKKPAGKPAAAPKASSAPKQPTEPKTAPAAPKPAVNRADSGAKPSAEPKTQSAAKPDESADQPLGERASLRRARDREALRERRRLEEEVGALTTNVPTVEPAEEPKPLTRRQLRLQSLADQNPHSANQKPNAAKPAPKPKSTDDSPETTVMSVEEALAARRSHDPKTPVDPNLLNEDDGEIDLEVLAHQREMAARAAIISRRAAERERLRIENAKKGKEQPLSDPFTGALGNIREVEDRIAKTGVQGPKTESVSLDLDSSGKLSDKLKHNSQASKKPSVGKMPPKPASKTVKPVVKPASKVSPAKSAPASAKPQPVPAAKPAATPAVKPAAKPQVKTAGPNEQSTAEASTPQANVEMPRIEAVDAQGLQPLDAQTHGVRRANNMLIAMIAALSVGGAALIAGIVMLISSLSS